MVTTEQLREALGERAAGKSDAEVWRIAEPVRRLAKVIVQVYVSACARSAVDSGPAIPKSSPSSR